MQVNFTKLYHGMVVAIYYLVWELNNQQINNFSKEKKHEQSTNGSLISRSMCRLCNSATG